jgi:hypothetical protein
MKQQTDIDSGPSVAALMGREPSPAEARLILPFWTFPSAPARRAPRR